MQGYIYQINISKGGVPKLPVKKALITPNGISGDIQKDKRYHGGAERAVCLFSLEEINRLKNEGHPVFPGSTGENITVSGMDWHKLQPGDILHIGQEVVLQITSYTAPCKTIQESFINHEFKLISQKVHPGSSRLYAKVLHVGTIQAGETITVLQKNQV